LVGQSLLFWLFALPLAILAWPVLLLTEKARNILSFQPVHDRKQVVVPQLIYRLA
jgi:hypothetical protein